MAGSIFEENKDLDSKWESKLENMKDDGQDFVMHLKDFDTLKMVYENVLDITTAVSECEHFQFLVVVV